MSIPETQVSIQSVSFTTLIVIRRGRFTDREALMLALWKAGIKVTEQTRSLIYHEHFVLAGKETEVEVVVTTPRELNFTDFPTPEQVIKRCGQFGLSELIGEDVVMVCLDYGKEQPNDEWLTAVMDPIPDSNGDLRLLDVERGRDGRRWLNSHCEERMPLDRPILLARRK